MLYQDHEITDTTSIYSNHNEVPEAGERIKIDVEVKNVGGATAISTEATEALHTGSVTYPRVPSPLPTGA